VFVSRRLLTAVTTFIAEEERQNVRAFAPHSLQLAIDSMNRAGCGVIPNKI